MTVCKCAPVHNAGEVSRVWYHRKEGKYKILITKLIQTFSCCMTDNRKHCHCPVKDLVTFTYLSLLTLSRGCHMLIPASGGTVPRVPRRSLPGHIDAGELSKALVNWNLWKYVTCCTKAAWNLSWCLYVSLQTEWWFYKMHFIKDWPHYPKVMAASVLTHLGCEDLLLVSNMFLMLHIVVFWK